AEGREPSGDTPGGSRRSATTELDSERFLRMRESAPKSCGTLNQGTANTFRLKNIQMTGTKLISATINPAADCD
ncbi:MAG: hypothetical protein ABJJ13_15590, partial [Rhodopirellula bahusiensis]|uniref:hypothetical protein n=1 Tax=Rhodopirellula bahusiensis TaxID=2014065 RepID=UPI003298A6A6